MLKDFIFRNKYALAAAALILTAAWGGWEYYQSSKMPEETVKVGTVTRGELVKSISATGSLSAVDNVDISSKITGRIVEVLVEENQHVKAGDVLVRLDATALEATMLQNKARLDLAEVQYLRYENLLNQGAVSQAEYDAIYADYLVARNAYEKAVSDVEDTVIVTPIDGYIIGKPTPVGQTISSGISTPQVIMSVATLDNMQIETLVDETDIGQVKPGQRVRFTVDAYSDENFTGKVRSVSKAAQTENNVVYYKVYVDVDDAKGKLLPTMTARTEIIVSEAPDTMMVPANCIFRENKQSYVQIYDQETKETRRVNVTVGISNDSEVSVTAPELKEGEVLLVRKAVARQTNQQRRPMRL